MLHSTALRMHIIGPPLQPESPGPRARETVHVHQCRGRDHHIPYPKENSTPGYAVPSTTITILPVRDVQLGTHAQYPQGCPKLVYGKGWACPYGGRYGYAHGLCKRRSSGLDFGQECHSASGRSGDQQITDLGQGWASQNCKHPQGRAVSCRHTVSCQGTRRPGGMGCS